MTHPSITLDLPLSIRGINRDRANTFEISHSSHVLCCADGRLGVREEACVCPCSIPLPKKETRKKNEELRP